jgi:WD40 repeat protein/transcriptional regulator with XRE-family HTH domain
MTGPGPNADLHTDTGEPAPVPAPTTATTREGFGDLLTALRKRSGRTLRDLAAAVGSSPSTLSGWLRAERLPFASQQPVFAALLDALGVRDPEPWLDALVRLRDEGLRRRDEQPPYQGLESFRRADADRFFGRAALVARLLTRVQELASGTQPRLLLVVGASGAGKSSVLHAGLLAALEVEGVTVAELTPGAEPSGRLISALGPAPDGGPAVPAADAGIPPVPMSGVVVVDQFEEVFTTCEDHAERERFLTLLEEVATPDPDAAAGTGWTVVLGLRSDFYPALVATGRLTAALEDRQVVVGPMTADELTSAVVEPAARAGWTVDDELVTLLRRDFLPRPGNGSGHDAGALPLLSHALLETWQRATRGRLSVADYLATGGVAGAVEHSAEQIHEALRPTEQLLAHRLFLRLVQVGETAVTTRRPLPIAELDDLPSDVPNHPDGPAPSAREVASRFVDARLLTADDGTVRISHEALLGAWSRLGGWIDDSREDLLVQRRITEATRLWDEHDRDPSLLATGARLAAMRAWIASRPAHLPLTVSERAFVDASGAQADAAIEEERRRTRRLRGLVAVTSGFAVLAAVLAGIAVGSRTQAIDARDQAESREIALLAERVHRSDPGLAAQLAVTGYAVSPTSEARSALIELAATPRAARTLGAEGAFSLALAPSGDLVATTDPAAPTVTVSRVQDGTGLAAAATLPLSDTASQVRALHFAHDGAILAIGTTLGEVELWDLATPDAPERLGILTEGRGGAILTLRTDASGTELVAAGTVGAVLRWGLDDPAAPVALDPLPYEPGVHALTLHPDGRHLTVGDERGSITIWALDDPTEPVVTVLDSPDDLVWTVDLAPDGGALAAGLRSGRARVWDTTTLAAPEELELDEDGFDTWVNSVAFSGDGRHLAAASSEGTVRLWETAGWQAVRSLPHPTPVSAAGFSGDGRAVVSAATDGVTRVWSLDDASPTRLPAGVWSIHLAADGTRLMASSGAGGGIWDVTDPAGPPRPVAALTPREDGPLFSGAAAMRADGGLVASGTRDGPVVLHEVGDDGTVRLLDVDLTGPPGLVETVAFSSDGRYLAGGGGEGAVHVWDLATPEEPTAVVRFDAVTDLVNKVAWSPRTSLLAVGSAAVGAQLFDLSDVSSPHPLGELDTAGGDVYALTFSPDGQELALGGTSGSVLRFDVTDPAAPRSLDPLTGPVGRIMAVAFHPDGGSLAAAVNDGTTWVWDLDGTPAPDRWATFRLSEASLFSLAYHPSGRLLYASGADGELRRWVTDPEVARDRVCGGIGTSITEDEWPRYFLDRPYQPPC